MKNHFIKSGNSKKLDSRKKIDSDLGFTHLTTEPTLFNRSLQSVKEYLVKEYVLPLELIDGAMEEPDDNAYAEWLLDTFPDDDVPAPVPEVNNILLPADFEAQITEMAEGADESDEAAMGELLAAQEAVRQAERERIWVQRTKERQRVINKNILRATKRKSCMENFTENVPIQKAKHFLVHIWPLTSAISLRIRQSAQYKPSIHPQASSIHDILSIAAGLFSDVEVNPALRLKEAEKKLSSLKMLKSNGYDMYVRMFNERYQTVQQEGGMLDDAVLIMWFCEGLHDVPFKKQKENYEDRVMRKNFSDTFSGFVQEMTTFYLDWEKKGRRRDLNPDTEIVLSIKQRGGKKAGSISKSSGDKSDSKPAGGKDSSSTEPKDSKPAVLSSSKSCEICGRSHGGQCFDTKAIEAHYKKKMEEAINSSATAKEAYEARRARKQNVSSVLMPQVTSNVPSILVCKENGELCDCNLPLIDEVSKQYVSTDRDVIPSLGPTLSAASIVNHIAIPNGCVRFFSDDCAECSLVTEEGAKALRAFHRREDPILLDGVSECAVNEIVTLSFDLGDARIHPKLNVLANTALLEHYTEIRYGVNGDYPHFLVYTHKTNGSTWTFTRDPECYGNKLWNIDIKKSSGTQLVASFYLPLRIRRREPTAEEQMLISDAKSDHYSLGHPADDIFKWQIANVPGIVASERGLELWREIEGKCLGCLADKPAHSKLPSTKPIVCNPGEVIVGDIMFLDSDAKKKPALLLVDVGSACPFLQPVKGRTLGDLKEAISSLLVNWTASGHNPTALHFDRESAILAAKGWLESLNNMFLRPTAAGQKQPIAEVNIRILKSIARRNKAGILARFGYTFPFNFALYRHAAAVVRSTIKRGQEKPPIERLTGNKVDYEREFRCELGEPIYVEKPKAGVYTSANEKMEIGIYLGTESRTGVLEVYLLKTRRKVHRIAFERGELPEWARQELLTLKSFDEEPNLLVDEEVRLG